MAQRKGVDREQLITVWEGNGGSIPKTARELGIAPSTVYYHLDRLGLRGKVLAGGQVQAPSIQKLPLPPPGQVARYIVTSAQNNTHVHGAVWDNLQALADYYSARILCASYTYNLSSWGKLSVKRGTERTPDRELWYDPAVEPLLEESDRELLLAPGLRWCGQMNTLPTAALPLSGFETYTGRDSGIFPHAKLAMQSVASGKNEATKLNYSTGTVTQRNYIQKRQGLKAEFHHSYGGLLVEVDSEGRWYVRQLNAHEDGSFHDLGLRVAKGRVHEEWGSTVEAINWGDAHVAEMDDSVRLLAWGDDGMLNTLRPAYQFLHDVLSFRSRSHWDIRDPHKLFALWRGVEGKTESVEEEVREVARFIADWAHRDWCKTIVVDSNHDNMLERWLREEDYRRDPVNAIFFLRCQLAKYEALDEQDGDFHMMEHVMRSMEVPESVRFLREDESFVICDDGRGGGIECGMHGHLGPDGARGSPSAFRRMGRRANTGHTHSSCIMDGLYVAGTCSRYDVGWNRGPSSWSQSHIITYRGGKRAIATMWDQKWRA